MRRPARAPSAWRLVAGVELRRRLRNRSAIVTAFVGPLALAVVFGVLLGGTSSWSTSIGLLDTDGGELSSEFVGSLVRASDEGDTGPVAFVRLDEGSATVTGADPVEVASAAVDGGDVLAVLVVPSGFGDAVLSGRPTELVVVRDPANPITGEVARSVADRFAVSLRTRTVAAATSAALGAPLEPADLAGLQESVVTAVDTEAPGGGRLDATSHFGVTMSILFLFFTVSYAARGIVAERANGILPRMLASSAAPWAVVTGKVVAVSLLGLAGFTTVWVVTSVAFGADWGDPVAVLATMVCTVLAVAGVSMFVSGFARTEAQADGYTSMVAFALALLGGNFVGPGQAPTALRAVAGFTPNGQAIAAFTEVSVDGAGVGDLAAPLSALLGFAVVFGAIGLVRVGRVMRG